MEQIAVVKIIATPQGEIRRNMMLPKNIWESIVKENPDKEVRWELRRVEPIIVKEIQMIKPDEIREVELVAEKPKEEKPKKRKQW